MTWLCQNLASSDLVNTVYFSKNSPIDAQSNIWQGQSTKCTDFILQDRQRDGHTLSRLSVCHSEACHGALLWHILGMVRFCQKTSSAFQNTDRSRFITPERRKIKVWQDRTMMDVSPYETFHETCLKSSYQLTPKALNQHIVEQCHKVCLIFHVRCWLCKSCSYWQAARISLLTNLELKCWRCTFLTELSWILNNIENPSLLLLWLPLPACFVKAMLPQNTYVFVSRRWCQKNERDNYHEFSHIFHHSAETLNSTVWQIWVSMLLQSIHKSIQAFI